MDIKKKNPDKFPFYLEKLKHLIEKGPFINITVIITNPESQSFKISIDVITNQL